jgi:hypothetical protein
MDVGLPACLSAFWGIPGVPTFRGVRAAYSEDDMSRSRLLAGLAVLAVALPLAAQTPLAVPPRDSVIIIGTVHRIHSNVLGEDRPYLIYEPPGARGRPMPLIVLLDGDGHFHHTTGAVRFLVEQGRMPPVRLVAVPNTSDRTRDLTPAILGDTAARRNSPTAGGADRTLRFLSDELLPEVERTYGAAPFHVLIGHSFGGLIAAYTLLARPEMFQAYIAISPSLWWDRERLTDSLVTRLTRGPQMQGWFYATMGGLEGEGMIAPFDRFERAMREHAPATLESRFTVLPGEDHGSTPHRSTYDGLEMIFRQYRVPQDSFVALGVAGIDRRYAEVRALFGFPDRTPEVALNVLGYLLLADSQASRHALALEPFRENVRRFPRSANTYDSMGDGFLAVDQKAAALTCFAASVRTGRAYPNEGTPTPGSVVAPASLGKMEAVARELGRTPWTPETIPERVTAECLAGRS